MLKILNTVFLVAISIALSLACSGLKNQPLVKISSELGDIIIALDQEHAPVTCANFLKYVDEQRFDSASFYRVVRMDNQPNNDIKIEVIQGGLGFDENSNRLPSIDHETTAQSGILHKHGTISMARAEPGTAASEIFICINDQTELDFGGKRNPDGQGFAAFGQVIDGMQVVKEIQQLPVDGQMLKKPIRFNITRFNKKKK